MACKRSCCCHFDQERFSTYFERVLLFDGLSRCLQIVPLGSGRFRRVERESGTAAASCDHLEPTPVEIQARICQACDAGSRSQNGGGHWGGSLDIYSPTMASSLSSIQRTRSSSTHPVVCAALFVLRQPHLLVPGVALARVSAAAFLLLCAATAGAFGIVVVVHFPFELADGGFTRMSVFVTLIVSAGVFTLVDFYFILLGCSQRLKSHSSKRQLRGVTMPQRRRLHHGWTWVTPPEASSFHLQLCSLCSVGTAQR